MIWTYDAGATGGGSWVELYDLYGFRSEKVFGGGWKSVNQKDVRWIDNTRLAIRYDHWDGYDEQNTCTPFHSVKVICTPK